MSELVMKGTIEKIGSLEQISDKFKKVDWVLNTGGDYPQKIAFQTIQKNADSFVKHNKVGDVVDVKFNVKGREWVNPQGEVKYFNTLEAWFISKASGQSGASTPNKEFEKQTAAPVAQEDDLPFSKDYIMYGW